MCQLTEILNGLPKKHGMTLEELADRMGYDSVSTLARQLNPNDEGRRFPASKLVLICQIFDDYTPLEHLCKMSNRAAVPLPKESGRLSSEEASRFLSKLGGMVKTIANSMIDGVIDSKERDQINRDGSGLFQDLGRILSKTNK